MYKNIKLMPIIPKKMYFKYSGINLIGLMISSALGVFIISIIIKISITINNNLQLIAAYVELEQSARLIQRFFENVFNSNGYGISAINNRTNNYVISNNTINNRTARFSMWYVGSTNGDGSGSINSTISCTGRNLDNTSTQDHQIMIFFKNLNLSNVTQQGYITCRYAPATSTTGDAVDISSPDTAMPLVDRQLVVKVFIAAIVANQTTPKYQIVPIVPGAAPSIPLPNYSMGIKLGILLRSREPVFSVDRQVEFLNVLNVATNDDAFDFQSTDKFLYKLIIIQSPFINNISDTPGLTTSITTVP